MVNVFVAVAIFIFIIKNDDILKGLMKWVENHMRCILLHFLF